jgi:hypothetical protein
MWRWSGRCTWPSSGIYGVGQRERGHEGCMGGRGERRGGINVP